MPYKVVFVGLANFVEDTPQGRVALLPDGRMPPDGIDPHVARIVVNAFDVEGSENWEPTTLGYVIDEPSEIVLSGLDPGPGRRDPEAFDDRQFAAEVPQLKHFARDIDVVPSEAQFIAEILIRHGKLEARWLGRSLVAQLTVEHDGPVIINAKANSGTVRMLQLRAGAEIVIANTTAGGESSFQLYGRLDIARRMDKLAEIDVGELQRLSVPQITHELALRTPDAPSAVTATSPGRRVGRAPRRAGSGVGRTTSLPGSPPPPTRTRSRPRGRGMGGGTFGVAPPSPAPPPPPPAAVPASMVPKESEPSEIPREFYGRFDAPSDVENDVEFTITAGITAEAQSAGDARMSVPDNVTGAFDLTLSIQAPAFKLKKNIVVFTLPVTAQNPYPTIEIPVKARGVAKETAQTFAIDYSIAGQAIGSVERTIAVHPGANAKTRNAAQEKLRRAFSIAGAQEPPDLTVFIRYDNEKTLSWTLITPHKSVVTPIDPIETQIAGNPKDFSKNLVTNANSREGQAGLYEYLVGTGAEIRKVMPPRFWSALTEVAKACGKETPSLLIISNEPYIPWELATFDPDDDEPPHPELAPFLGVQVTVGRWLIGERVPPPVAHSVRQSYVLTGEYKIPKWNRLLNAEEEAKEISATYGATTIEAKQAHILGIFVKQPAADLIHFSMHGKSSEDSVEDGLIPIDGGAVKAQMITGAIEEAKKQQKVAPFVFLNACQVGAGQKILGDYGGMAAAFVNGGAAGVIAPLWSVKDDDARKIALEFYRATLTAGDSPAEAMRRARAQFIRKEDAPISATYLAYQFFGHPSLRLRKEP